MKVSVMLITYNHENFIAQALDSVLMQQTNFDYEIIISEDCSTDGTRDIVKEYQKTYPEKIRLLLSDHNLGSIKVFIEAYLAAQGEYVAMLDGDDYWTSPDKLQKQVDYLDTHPECSLCFHNVLVFYDDHSREAYYSNPPDQKEISTLEDMWTECFIETCAAMCRRDSVPDIPEWCYSIEWTDWALFILLAEQGQIGYINEAMGAYRQHSGGMYSSLSLRKRIKGTFTFYESMNVNLKYKYDDIVKAKMPKYFYDLAKLNEEEDDLVNARAYLREYISEAPTDSLILRIEALWREVREHKEWIGELEQGKAWLEDQRNNWQTLAEEREQFIQEQQDWIKELEEGKAWLEEQWNNWQTLAQEREQLIQEQQGWIKELEEANASATNLHR
jgi:glycosyltransferase involved in cell wall biosynthesis